MSGLMPTFSAIHWLCSGSHTAEDGAVTMPPSISGGEPARPTRPPHVRLPINFPTPEVPRHRVAARAGKFVDQHHFRAEDCALRLDLVSAVARRDAREQPPGQEFDDVGRQRAAAVEALVHDHRRLVDLREDRILRVAQAVGDLRRFARGKRVQIGPMRVRISALIIRSA
jgi:hypothetical protein